MFYVGVNLFFWHAILFVLQVRGGFLNDSDLMVPLTIMSFKSAPTSSKSCPSASSSTHHRELERDNNTEEDKEVTVHLMKEEAGRFLFLFCQCI